MSATETESAQEAEVTFLPVNKIQAGDNPRKSGDDSSQEALNDSVRQLGIVTPITVRRSDDGEGWTLIAGQRRLIAALTNKLEMIPAIVRQDNEDEEVRRAVAIVENLHREPLKPMEEARAFAQAAATLSPTQIAKAYSISEQTVRDRLGLLSLPESLHPLVDSGEVPMHATRAIAKIAQFDERLGEACATVIIDGRVDIHRFASAPGWSLQNAVRIWNQENNEDFLLLWKADANELDPTEVGWTDEQIEQVEKTAAFVHDAYDWAPILSKEEIDQARAYGCLLEVSSTDGEDYAFITDPQWLFEFGVPALERKAERLRENPPQATRSGMGSAPGRTGRVKKEDMTDKQREEYEAQRKAEAEAKYNAIADNEKLGAQLLGKLKVKADKRTMLLLGLVIGQKYADTIGRGVRYTVEELRTVTEKKSGGTRVEYASPAEGYDWWINRLNRLKTADEILHHIVFGLAAAEYCDEEAVPKSARSWASPAGGGSSEIAKQLLSLTRSAVPARMKERAETRLKESADDETDDDLL